MSISEFIAADLRTRIQSGDRLPESLTLQALAKHYSVSMMPVRTAVSVLIEEKIIRKGANGRLGIVPVAEKLRIPRATPPPDWKTILQEDAIREGLRGQTRKWKISDTAERYGIGRALVQSIFQRLAGMGILEHVPRCGWRACPFREEDLDAYLKIRVLLELKALDMCLDQIEPEVIRRIRDGNQTGSTATPPSIDNSLHHYWVDLSGNRYIQEFFARHGAYYVALYDYAVIGDSQLSKIAHQHRLILSAVLERNRRVAKGCLAEDIESLRPLLLETIRQLNLPAARS